MSFVQAVQSVIAKSFQFGGRATRPEFWYFYLFLFLVGVASGIVDLALGLDRFTGVEDLGPANIIVFLLAIIPSLSVGARRLHDMGRSGWWQLIGLVPAIGFIVLIVWWCQPSNPEV